MQIVKIRIAIGLFMLGLIISGLSAIPLETETAWLVEHTRDYPTLNAWVAKTHDAVQTTNFNHPFLSYGTDWLAFAHVIIAMAFIGVLRDPYKNKWIIEWGMIACILVFPTAALAGTVRGIPLFWQLIDCSFGVIGLIPLVYSYKLVTNYRFRIANSMVRSTIRNPKP